MYTYIFCFLITITAVYASKEFSDYTDDPDRLQYEGLNFAIGPTDCVKPGPICDGCDKRFECIEIGINEYIVVPLAPCSNGTTCSSGMCTANQNPSCNTPPSNGYKFKCYQVGLFPDALDCQKYHLCVPEDVVDPGITTTSDVPTMDSTLDSVSSTVSDVPTTDSTVDFESSTVSNIPTIDSTLDSGSSTISVIPTIDSTLDSGSSTVSDVPTTDSTVDFGSSTGSVIPTIDSTLDSGSSTVSNVPTTDSTGDFGSSTGSVIPTIDSTLDSASSTVSDVPTTESTVDFGSSTGSVIPTIDSTLNSGSSTVSLFPTIDSTIDSGSSTVSYSTMTDVPIIQSLKSVNIISFEFYCGDGFYFDSRTNLCRKKLVNGVCPYVTGPCKTVGDVGVLASNPALYYVCINEETPNGDEIFPQIFVCLNNLEYDVATKRCLDPTPISGTGPDGKTCIAMGKFADSSDCTHYKDCSSIGAIAISKACPTSTYFDHKTSACAEFTCADVEKREYKTHVAISNELYVFSPLSADNPLVESYCTRPGTVCKDCTERIECIEIGEDQYTELDTGSCPTGTTCVISTGACTANPNPDCHPPEIDGYEFECHQAGVFPDAFDCQAYHLCAPKNPPDDIENPGVVDPISTKYTCKGDFYYDPRTTLCRKKLINGTCPIVTGPCNAVGDVGVLASNPALYYICLSGTTSDPDVKPGIFPQIFVCINNFEYNVTARRCVDPTPISGTGENGRCIAVGQFADPSGCSFYKDCSAINATAITRSCATRTYFSPMKSTCVEYTCADVDK